MTDSNTRGQLEQAYDLIQREELDKALTILKPIVAAQPNNGDAWWLMANAVAEPNDAYQALSNVIRLEPQHPQARELLDSLLEEFPELAKTPIQKAPPAAAPRPAVIEDTSLDDLFSSSAMQDLDLGLDDVPAAGSNSSSNYDLHEFFGSDTTANQDDDDLDTMFGSDLKEVPTMATEDKSLDDFFRSAPSNSQGDPLNDPFSSSDPTFASDKALKDATRSKRGQKDPTKTAKKPAPTKIAAPTVEVVPADPLEIERRANRRRSPLILIVSLLILVILIGGGIYVFTHPSTGTPDSTVQTIQADLAADGFQNSTISNANGSLQVTVCGLPGPRLRNAIYQAMDIIAEPAANARSSIKVALIEVDNCLKSNALLYRASAPISVITTYVDNGKKDVRSYRIGWTQS